MGLGHPWKFGAGSVCLLVHGDTGLWGHGGVGIQVCEADGVQGD